MNKILLCLLALALVSCGGDSGGSSSSSDDDGTDLADTNAMVGTFAAVVAQNERVGNLAPASSSSIASLKAKNIWELMTVESFGNKWEDENIMVDETSDDSGATTSIKEWFGHQLSEDAVRDNGSSISVFGRISSDLEVFCAVGVMVDEVDSNGYPDDGEHSFEITESNAGTILDECGLDASDAVGLELTIEVSTPDDTSVYDKRIYFPRVPNGGTQEFYIKKSGTTINMTAMEKYDLCDSDEAPEDNCAEEDDTDLKISKTQIFIDGDTLRAQYISGSNNGAISGDEYIEAYRVFFDGDSGEGYFFGLQYRNEQGGSTLAYALRGKPDVEEGASLSVSFMAETQLEDSNERHACVELDTGDITTDGGHCSDTDTSSDGVDVSEVTTLLDLRSGYDSEEFNTISETEELDFTSSNVLTSDFY